MKSLGVFLMKRLESDFACKNPNCNREVDSLENHCLEACFKPYMLFLSLQTQGSLGLK
jgi:hypothetical protein